MRPKNIALVGILTVVASVVAFSADVATIFGHVTGSGGGNERPLPPPPPPGPPSDESFEMSLNDVKVVCGQPFAVVEIFARGHTVRVRWGGSEDEPRQLAAGDEIALTSAGRDCTIKFLETRGEIMEERKLARFQELRT